MTATLANTPAELRDAWTVFARHGSPRVLAAALTTALAARIAVGGWSAWDLAPVAIVAALWPLQEWLIHVFVLHAKPRRIGSLTYDSLYARKHRLHHRDPWNIPILFIPLRSYWVNVPALVLLYWLVTPTLQLALTAIAVHLAGALQYEWVHFLVHTRVVPKSRFYTRLWRNHRLHHFKNEHYWHGVTRVEADWLLGTSPEPSAVVSSPTARGLQGAAIS